MPSFKPIEFKKVNILILKDDLERVGNILYDLRLMELFRGETDNLEDFQLEDTSEESSKLLEIRSAINILKKFYKADIISRVENPVEKTKKLSNKLKKIREEILNLEDLFKRQEILGRLKIDQKKVEENKIIVGFIDSKNKENIKRINKKDLISKLNEGKRIYFAIRNDKNQAKDLEFSFKEFYLPKRIRLDLPLKIRDAKKEEKKILNELEYIANSSLSILEKKEKQLSKKISLEFAKSNFKRSQNIVLLSGFVPRKQLKTLKNALVYELGDSFDIEIIDIKDDNAPTHLEHKNSSRNFVELLKMYSLPKYREFDPTFLMFLIFPLFYGFILGDFGYGLLSLIVFTLFKKKKKELKEFMTILQYSSISSMFFGIIYGEYFGFEPYHIFSRMTDPELLLKIAILFGFLHINIGILIGFYNELKKSFKKALYHHLSWIILEIGLILLAMRSIYGIGYLLIPSILFILLGVVLLYLGHGIMGIIEIPSFFTNILSYARLMAVGISSVVIAILVNEFTMKFFENGVVGIIIGIIIFTIGHIFNIVLGNFESFLHTLRLHYVEFFTKFYSGGGREFKPFGREVEKNN